MEFGDIPFDEMLPGYLLNADKDRIKKGLAQFFEPDHRQKEKIYNSFYLEGQLPPHFMQGDLIHSLPIVDWDEDAKIYYTAFSPVMLISNSCDITADNDRLLDKEALFAQVIPLEEFIKDLTESGLTKDQITSIHNSLKQQDYSNIFYLPPNPIDHRELIVFFDKICWHPSIEFQKKLSDIKTERVLALHHFGYYMLIAKLSFHFCRVPEDLERTVQN